MHSALRALRLALKTLKIFGPLCPPLQIAAEGFLSVLDGCTVSRAAFIPQSADGFLKQIAESNEDFLDLQDKLQALHQLLQGHLQFPHSAPARRYEFVSDLIIVVIVD